MERGEQAEHADFGVVLLGDLPQCAPPELFVLALPDSEGGGLELRETDSGETMLLTYTAMDHLVEACGYGQTYVRTSTDQLERLAGDASVAMVAVDVPLPEGHRYPETDQHAEPELAELDETPPDGLVYVPSKPTGSRRGRDVVLELQPHEGRRTLLAYDSLETLRAGCGPYQSCVSVRADRLDEVASRAGAEAVLFNPVLSEQARHTAPVRDWRTG